MDMVIRVPATEIRIAYEGANFNRIEEEITRVVKCLGVAALKKALVAVDEQEYNNRDKALKVRSKEKKYVTTLFGEIEYERRRYRDKGTNEIRYLTDEKLGIGKREKGSPRWAMMESELSFMAGSYRKASEIASKWIGSVRSHESFRQTTIKAGWEIKEHEDSEIKQAEIESYNGGSIEAERVENNAVVYGEVDGTGIKLQGRDRKEKKRCEVKLAIGYLGHENRYAAGSGKQKRLKEKFAYVGIEEADEFMSKFSILCEKSYNMSEAKAVIMGGDGAAWIKEGIRSYFPDAHYVLCKFHLNRAVKRAFGYNKKLEAEIRGYLCKNQIDKSIKKIGRIIKVTSKSKKDKIKKLLDLRKYIAYNGDGINALERLKMRLTRAERSVLRSTGAIEGNIDKVIAQRMKNRGMSWSIKGCVSMLKVISKVRNGKWEEWWLKDRQKKIEISDEDYKKLIETTFWRDKVQQPVIPTANMPALEGPFQDKIWAGVLRDIKDGSETVN